MNPGDSEQTDLLRAIWNEMKALGANLGARIDATNERIDETNRRLETFQRETNARLDQTNARLDQTNARLEVIESTLVEAATQQLVLGRFVKNVAERLRESIADLGERVSRLERERG
jgi:methyl-accepting chemotaxis protein